MKIDNDFALDLEPDAAYALLLDIAKVVPCMPGAEMGETTPDGEQHVTVTVKLGPMRFVYGGTVKIGDTDAGARRAVMTAKARERRGGGTAEATITMQVKAGDGGTSNVTCSADIALTGRAAQSGRGIVEDVSKRMVAQMADSLNSTYGKSSAAATANHDAQSGAAASSSASQGAGPRRVAAPAAPPASKPIGGGSLILKVIAGQIAGLFKRLTRVFRPSRGV